MEMYSVVIILLHIKLIHRYVKLNNIVYKQLTFKGYSKEIYETTKNIN